ncbi:MAG: L-threonylcarbamoyladenylate synthase [Bacilli bacterium]|nr:L-threonylcarbamoyladenylate synthase [Bacilli bacterium]
MEKIILKEFLKLKKEDVLGKVICFPTDTVYGVAAFIDDEASKLKLYKMKNRSLDKPFAILIYKFAQVKSKVLRISKKTKKIMKAYWPGALTIILDTNTSPLGFRVPNSKIALKILKKFGPLYATSVNESGEKEINDISLITEKYSKDIDYLITDKTVFSSIASTVIKINNDKIEIIRQGGIIVNE